MQLELQSVITVFVFVAGFGGMMQMMRTMNNSLVELLKEVPHIEKDLVAIKVRLDYIEEKIKTIASGCPLLESKQRRK